MFDCCGFEGAGFAVALLPIVRAPAVFEEADGGAYEEPICDDDGPGEGGFEGAVLYAVCALKAARKLAKKGLLVVMAANTRVQLSSA